MVGVGPANCPTQSQLNKNRKVTTVTKGQGQHETLQRRRI